MVATMNKIKGILVSTLLLLSLLTIIAPVSAGTIHVYPGDDLESKINSASSGDTVYIHAGTYAVDDLIVIQDKSLTLIGDGDRNTIIVRSPIPPLPPYWVFEFIANGIPVTIDISKIYFNAPSGTSSFIFYGNNPMNVNIDNCRFNNSAIDLGSNPSNLIIATIQNCEFEKGEGVYLDNGERQITIKNCLFYDCMEYAIIARNKFQLTVQSCTIDKSINDDGIHVEGGIDASLTVKDSIITNNPGNGIYNDGTVNVTSIYNNVWNNGTNYSGVTPGIGSISKDPHYTTGRLGNYYLSFLSPSVDKGSTLAAILGLADRTTRIDEKWDTLTIDMGYHYPSNRGPGTSLPIDFIIKLLKGNRCKNHPDAEGCNIP
jgi:hypothetical protein